MGKDKLEGYFKEGGRHILNVGHTILRAGTEKGIYLEVSST